MSLTDPAVGETELETLDRLDEDVMQEPTAAQKRDLLKIHQNLNHPMRTTLREH